MDDARLSEMIERSQALNDPQASADEVYATALDVHELIQEVHRLRCRISYLEGWKEGVEPFVAKHRPRPPVYRSPADETRQAAENRLNRA